MRTHGLRGEPRHEELSNRAHADIHLQYKHATDGLNEEAVLPLSRSDSQKSVLNWLVRAFLAWLFVYLVQQGQDGFLARTVDRIDALWVKLTLLNPPLQVLLTLATSACAGSERPTVLRLGLWVAGLNGLLILVHIALSVATA